MAWIKTPEDIAALARLQRALLDAAARLVAPGGRLVFCTCSLEREEGEDQARNFLERHGEFAPEPVTSDEVAGFAPLLTPEGWLRTLPSSRFGPDDMEAGMDGFFAARFVRRRA